MTVKEIAQAVGKKERAVHNWVKEVSAKNAQVSAKIAQAKATSKPADYTIEETIKIIESGIGAEAAGVFRANAEQTESKDKTTPLKTIMNGSALDKLIKIYGPHEAGQRLDYLIGYREETQEDDQPLPNKEAIKALQETRRMLEYKDKHGWIGDIVEQRSRAKEEAEKRRDSLQNKFDI